MTLLTPWGLAVLAFFAVLTLVAVTGILTWGADRDAPTPAREHDDPGVPAADRDPAGPDPNGDRADP
jgi:hypothetical protein